MSKIPLYPSSVAPNEDDLLIIEDSVTANTKKIKRSDLLGGNTITATNDIKTDAIEGITDADSGTVFGVPVTNGVIPGANVSGVTNPYRFSANRTANQTGIADATFVTVAFNNEVFDTNNNFDTSTYKYTCPVTGYYQFNVAVHFYGTGMNFAGIQLVKNAGTAICKVIGATTAEITPVISGLYHMEANDTVYVQVYGDVTSGTVTIIGTNIDCQFDGYLVSL